MYNKLIRFFSKNRKQVFRIILVIVLMLGIIQLLDYLDEKENKKNSNVNLNVSINNSNNVDSYKEIVSDKSLISGSTVSENKLKNDVEIINEFVKYCNEGNVESAYQIITDECKEEMFPTIQDFNNIYYSKIFNGQSRNYTVENWIGNVYQVRYTEDILSTGNINNSNTKNDYITIVNNNEEYKLNINNYVGRKTLNKVTEYQDIKITVTNVDTYMDYEIYDLVIENNSENAILLDTSDDTKSIYLLDSKNMKYYSYSHEILENKLLIQSKFKNKLQIKFSNSFSSNRSIKNLVFSKFVLNYDEYKKVEDKTNYEGIYQFKVKI